MTTGNRQLVQLGHLTVLSTIDFPPAQSQPHTAFTLDDLKKPGAFRLTTVRLAAITSYTLGPLRGRIPILRETTSGLYREVWRGLQMQKVRGPNSSSIEQTPFFPSYEPLRSEFRRAMTPLASAAGLAAYEASMATRP